MVLLSCSRISKTKKASDRLFKIIVEFFTFREKVVCKSSPQPRHLLSLLYKIIKNIDTWLLVSETALTASMFTARLGLFPNNPDRDVVRAC